MRGDFEKGEREVALVQKMVRAAADAGIPVIKYCLCEREGSFEQAFAYPFGYITAMMQAAASAARE